MIYNNEHANGEPDPEKDKDSQTILCHHIGSGEKLMLPLPNSTGFLLMIDSTQGGI